MTSTANSPAQSQPCYDVFSTQVKSPTGNHLEHITRRLAEKITLRAFQDPIFRCFADELDVGYDGFPVPMTRQQYLAEMEFVMRANPEHTYETVSTCSFVRSSKRKATVWATFRVSSRPLAGDGIEGEYVIKLDWRWEREVGWRCVSKIGLKGLTPST